MKSLNLKLKKKIKEKSHTKEFHTVFKFLILMRTNLHLIFTKSSGLFDF